MSSQQIYTLEQNLSKIGNLHNIGSFEAYSDILAQQGFEQHITL